MFWSSPAENLTYSVEVTLRSELQPRRTVIRQRQHTACTVWDTCARRNLKDDPPVSVVDTNWLDTSSAIVTWELKIGPLYDYWCGQVYGFLKTISQGQRHRSDWLRMLSNREGNLSITLIHERRIGNGAVHHVHPCLGYTLSHWSMKFLPVQTNICRQYQNTPGRSDRRNYSSAAEHSAVAPADWPKTSLARGG